MTARLAIDIGGTFTDFVLEASDSRLWTYKTLTTPDDYTDAIRSGVQALLANAATSPAAIGTVLHATTLASNTLLERKGAPTGLITTAGFRDVLEIRDLRMPRLYDLTWEKPKTLVPRRWRRVVRERLDVSGEVLQPLVEEDVVEALRFLRADGVRSLAVCLLHAYAWPEHELRIRELATDHAPELAVSLSHELLAEAGEYPRTSTTVINAYVQPPIQRYIAHLRALLTELGIRAPLLFMQSCGGLMPADLVAAAPIHIIESGPAAGVVGAAEFARRAGYDRVITLDIGGTTAKAALVEQGHIHKAAEFQVGGDILQLERLLSGGGFTLRVPAIDLAEVGAGGGSLVVIDEAGVPKVGPGSAGADPGPVCYGRGGTSATVTDCNLALGYLDVDSIAGGSLRLDRTAAEQAVTAQLATPLGTSAADAALGAFKLTCTQMLQAIRAVTTERGRDPRAFTLFAFGSNGPLFAAAIAEAMGCRHVLVPPAPGVFSALGLLCAQIEIHKTVSVRGRLDDARLDILKHTAERLAAAAASDLEVAVTEGTISVAARLRYAGQSSDLHVVLGGLAGLDTAAVQRAFEAEHDHVFKFRAPEGEPVDLVTVEVTFALRSRAVDLGRLETAAAIEGGRRQRAHFGGVEAEARDIPVVARTALQGALEGPGVILDTDATTLLPPGWRGARAPSGIIVLGQGQRAEGATP